MILTFNELHIENFMSIREATFELDNNGFVSIKGNNYCTDDGASSNGSGKSCIWEALSYCITGDTIRGTKDIVSKFAEKEGCLVSVEFSLDNNNYKIIRTKNHSKYKTNLFVYVNDVDKSGKGIKDTEKILKTILPDITSELLNSVIILGQGLPLRFTNNTPSQRKEMLEELTKSDYMIEELKNKVSDRIKYLTTSAEDLEIEKSNSMTKGSFTNNLFQEEQTHLFELEKTDVEIIKKEIERLNAEVSKYTNTITNTVMENVSVKYEELNSLVSRKQAELDKLYSLKESSNECKAESVLYSTQIQSLKDKIKDLGDGVCPTCGKPLDNFDSNELEVLNNSLDEVSDKYNKAVSESKDYLNKFLKATDEVEAKYSSIFSELKKSISDSEKSNSDKKNEIDFCVKEREKCTTNIILQRKTLETLDLLKKDAKAKIDSYRNQLAEIVDEYNRLDAELKVVNSKLDVVKKMDTLIKRDFRGYLLRNIVSFIENKCKEYAKIIFNSDKFVFTIDGNNIVVQYNGKDYESLSGGEKQKCDVIIQFAIRDMMATFFNFRSNVLVLDEITDNLDSVGCDKLFNFIQDKMKDISSVFIISHRYEKELPVEKTWVVDKNKDGVSSVRES